MNLYGYNFVITYKYNNYFITLNEMKKLNFKFYLNTS